MPGLLDFLSSPDAQFGLGLLGAAAPRAGGVNFGQGLQEALSYVDKQRQMKAAEMAQAQEMKMQQMQMAEYEQKRAREQEMQGLAQQFAKPAIGAAADGYGPTAPASFDRQGFGAALEAKDPMAGMAYLQSIQKQEPKMTVVAPGGSLVNERTGQALFTAPKEQADDPFVRLLKQSGIDPASPRGQQLMAQRLSKEATHQASTVVNMGDNLGLKPKDRFDMEGKLRGDYEKLTEADRGIIGSAQDIGSLLKQGGALKDQAAIYKFAKALDPMGAVREADYAAIVRTAGGLEYVQSLVNKALTGEQLSPKQRLEMERVSNGMANVAATRIKSMQQRTTANAKMYNLNPENLFSPSDAQGTGASPTQENDPLGIRTR